MRTTYLKSEWIPKRIRNDTHIKEDILSDVLYLFLLTCTVACSVCFWANQRNRAHY